MTPRPDLNNLAKEVYQANKLKGFHEVEHSNEHYLFSVIGNLMKALHSHRLDHKSNLIQFSVRTDYNILSYVDAFDLFIKDTTEIELAEAVIKLLDLAGLRRIEIYKYSNEERKSHFEMADKNLKNKPFSEIIIATVNAVLEDKDTSVVISQSILGIEWIARYLNIDLWQHVDLKLKYNGHEPNNPILKQ